MGLNMAVRNVNFTWFLVAVLYASCWFLPIHDGMIGFDGAELAHKEFWRLLTQGVDIVTPSDVFEAIFVSLGWLANELFVLGLLILRKRPQIAFRLLAFSLGVMISWQLAFPNEFPFLVGYWFWVVAGSLALWLVALRLVVTAQIDIRAVLGDRISQALILIPVLNAIAVGTLGLLAY